MFRSEDGIGVYLTLMAYVGTAKKNGIDGLKPFAWLFQIRPAHVSSNVAE